MTPFRERLVQKTRSQRTRSAHSPAIPSAPELDQPTNERHLEVKRHEFFKRAVHPEQKLHFRQELNRYLQRNTGLISRLGERPTVRLCSWETRFAFQQAIRPKARRIIPVVSINKHRLTYTIFLVELEHLHSISEPNFLCVIADEKFTMAPVLQRDSSYTEAGYGKPELNSKSIFPEVGMPRLMGLAIILCF